MTLRRVGRAVVASCLRKVMMLSNRAVGWGVVGVRMG